MKNLDLSTHYRKLKKGDRLKFKDGSKIYIIGAKGDGYDYMHSNIERGHSPKGWFNMMLESGKAMID